MRRALAFATTASLALAGCEGVPDRPVDVAWDAQACDDCHMHVADRRYAAELATDDGVLFFDDPGCLLHYVAERHPAARHVWVRDARHDAWLSRDEAAFVEAAQTPMGYGLAAVRRGTPGAFGWDEAAQRVTRARLADGER